MPSSIGRLRGFHCVHHSLRVTARGRGGHNGGRRGRHGDRRRSRLSISNFLIDVQTFLFSILVAIRVMLAIIFINILKNDWQVGSVPI